MKDKYVLLDVDDVLLNWFSGFERYMKHMGYPEIKEHGHYDLSKVFGITKKEIDKLIRSFNKRWEFGTLEPLTGSKKGLDKLRKNNYKFVAITSCSTDPTTIALRKTNLYWCFGDIFESVHCINLGESKETHLADYNPSWWIEDKFENAVAGLKYGHKSILMDKIHNEHLNDSELIRVKNWSQITDVILNNDLD